MKLFTHTYVVDNHDIFVFLFKHPSIVASWITPFILRPWLQFFAKHPLSKESKESHEDAYYEDQKWR